MTDRIRLGVSACLLGENVRYDGQHKLDRYIRDTIGEYVEFVPVCPEVECGLTVPREAMRLVGDPQAPHLMTIRTGIDHTERMLSWARRRVDELANEDLCGFIFKSGSPSSGMERIKVYSEKGGVQKTGVGLFARAFMERFPLLPVEDEGRLHDPKLRETFIEAVFTLKRWRDLRARTPTASDLMSFHAGHKLLIMAHSEKHMREMGRLAAGITPASLSADLERYQELLLDAVRHTATPRRNTNVLQHMAGYFKRDLSADERLELQELIDCYHQGTVPLIVPVTLIRHYVRKYRQPYLAEQLYLNPHPLELQLRNHV
jgi:uncharacterized protein YbgA (DUF1722 family)/uncharacterized protein YbbK (DUF523 family)